MSMLSARKLKITVTALALFPMLSLATDTRLMTDFSTALNDWAERSFQGNTSYSIATLDGKEVLQAEARGSASALYRETRIDLQQTPYLQWSWRIESTFDPAINEQSKAGDDYPARVYVVRRGGLAFWRTKTINYVWSSNSPVNQRWDNAYAGKNAQMWPLNSGDQQANTWVTHTRDIRADWRAAFGEDITSLDGIAVMTDADDSGASVRAWYSGMRFLTDRTVSGEGTGSD
jgi:hypothetical protein